MIFVVLVKVPDTDDSNRCRSSTLVDCNSGLFSNTLGFEVRVGL